MCERYKYGRSPVKPTVKGRATNILASHLSDALSKEGGNVVYRTDVYTRDHTSPRMVRIAAKKRLGNIREPVKNRTSSGD